MEIEIKYAKNGEKILRVDNININSSYNPSLESEKFVDSFKKMLNDPIIHIVGLGLGYHVKKVVEHANEDKEIKILVSNKKIYKKVENEQEIKNILQNKNVKIYFEEDIESFIKTLDKATDIMIYKSLLNFCDNKKIKDAILTFSMARVGIEKYKDIMEENEKYHSTQRYKNISQFIEKSTKRNKIIVSAGPSLDQSINELKRYRNNYEIYCVGSALKTLIDNEIYPDAIVIIDGVKIVENQLKGYNDLNIPLCFLSTASRWAVNKYKGDKYIFYNKDSEIIIETGKTVAVAAIDIAIKSGAEKILLVGQDLAYIDNRTHTKSFEEIYGIEDKVSYNKTKKVIDIKGENINTNSGYLVFKRNIENIIEKNPHIEFYNCSLGAHIEGTVVSSINKLFNKCE